MYLRNWLFSMAYFHFQKLPFVLRANRIGKKANYSIPFGVNYAGYLNAEQGLGEAARSIIRIIQEAKIPVVLNNITHRWQRDIEAYWADSGERKNPYVINILHVNADMVPYVSNMLGTSWFEERYSIGYWVWELDYFPEKWSVCFKCFEEIWVPSDFCRQAIARISPIPVKTIPHSIQFEITGEYQRSDWGIHHESFMFLYVFDLQSSFERKNPLAVIEAFQKAFSGRREKEVVLVLKCTGSHQNRWAYKKMLKASKNLPIRIIDSYMKRDELYGLMSLCDCYISLHRSEGFGLTLAEAMYLGKPVIATAYSGNLEFMNAENSCLVQYDMQKIERTAGPYQKGHFWANPDISQAAKFMRYLYESRTSAYEIGVQAAFHIKKNFSPEALKDKVQGALKMISYEQKPDVQISAKGNEIS